MSQIIVSGIQTTGNMHLGNYLGSVNYWPNLQSAHKCLFFLADLHALTTIRSKDDLRTSIIQTAAICLSTGLDPDQSIIYRQSDVLQHAELAWIFNSIVPLSWLYRMTQFKDKTGANQDSACLGLLSYPVLMAADILLYKANLVPVGEDQKQHLELTRDIAGLFNRQFEQDFFELPQPLINKSGARIMSLKDGKKKMSKSDPSPASRINLNDSSEVIIDKIKRAKTDSIVGISYDKINRPEISNLIEIYACLKNQNHVDIIKEIESMNNVTFKANLSELIISRLTPVRAKYLDLMHNQDYLSNILKKGAEQAAKIAQTTMKQIKELIGLKTSI